MNHDSERPTRNSDSGSQDRSRSVVISVVIGTFNGSRTLAAALDALERQSSDVPFEVIVVNDASTDATLAIATRPGIRCITLEKNQGHGHTLNVGLSHARGEFMAMMDDDCVPPPQWIQRITDAWKIVSANVTMIGGTVEPLASDTFNRRYVGYRKPLIHQESGLNESAGLWRRVRYSLAPPAPVEGRRSVYYTVGANMAVRVSSAREVGGFTEERGAGEEESLARLLRAKFGFETVQLFPDIVMKHDFQAPLSDSLRRARSYGRAHGRNWVRDRDIPTVAPRPLFCGVATVACAFVNPVLGIVSALVTPMVIYRGWVRSLRDGVGVEALSYPFVHFIEDVSCDVGFVAGALHAIRSHT